MDTLATVSTTPANPNLGNPISGAKGCNDNGEAYASQLSGANDCDDADADTHAFATTNEVDNSLCMRDADADGWGDMHVPASITEGRIATIGLRRERD